MSTLSTAARAKRDLAEQFAQHLRPVDDVIGVCVYGSVARGDATELSDIDLMILGTDRLNSETLNADLRQNFEDESIAIQVRSQDELIDHLKRSPVFALHVRHEGVILFDKTGEFTRIIESDYPVEIEQELAVQQGNLRLYEEVGRFGEALLIPLARVYSIGRATVFLRLWENGIVEFNASKAFKRLAEVRPQWASQLTEIASLRPFYQSVRSDRLIDSYPFDPSGLAGRDRLQSGVGAVSALFDNSKVSR